jgi:hypothetical protein
MRKSYWFIPLVIAGCATAPRDDYKLRRDIAGLNLVKMSMNEARAVLADQKFVCGKETEPYAGSLLKTADCKRAIRGIGCQDDEQVTLEYKPETGLVERVSTRRINGCN